MKQLLNTLYVTTQGAYLAKDGEAVAVRVEQETKLRVPIHTLASIVCFGQVGCSPFLMGLCGERGVALAFLTEHGRFLARVEGPVSGNVLLRREQYRWGDQEERAAAVARAVVTGKIANCRTVVLRALREKAGEGGAEEMEQAARRLGRLLETVAGTAETAANDRDRRGPRLAMPDRRRRATAPRRVAPRSPSRRPCGPPVRRTRRARRYPRGPAPPSRRGAALRIRRAITRARCACRRARGTRA